MESETSLKRLKSREFLSIEWNEKVRPFFSDSSHCANEEFVIFADDDKKSP